MVRSTALVYYKVMQICVFCLSWLSAECYIYDPPLQLLLFYFCSLKAEPEWPSLSHHYLPEIISLGCKFHNCCKLNRPLRCRLWHQRVRRRRANAAATFGNNLGGFGNYPPQGRSGGAGGGNYSAFSDESRSWTEPHSGTTTPVRSPATSAKAKTVGLAAIPLPQKGDF